MNWNISEAICQLAASPISTRPALIHDDEIVTYAQLAQRATGMASWLSSLNLPAGSHVGHYMRNSNAYMETFIASGLAGMSHVNVNFRYLDDELLELCNGLDISVLVYDREFSERVAQIKDRLQHTVAFVEISDETPLCDFAIPISATYRSETENFKRQTSPDDLVLIATGGTTGLPKGTQWRQEDLWFKLNISRGGGLIALGLDQHPATMEDHVVNVVSLGQPAPLFPLCPLMHGTGLLVALMMLAQGAAVVTLSGSKFDPARTLDAVEKHGVGGMVLVGDAFAQPLLEELERRLPETPLATLQMIISSGSILSDESKAGLLRHKPGLVLIDTLGSSEAIGFGVATEETGVFAPMPTTRVFDDQMQEVTPGSDTIGIAYSSGYTPVGYYNEPQKSAETFVEIAGTRYVKTGDRCRVREDGMLVLLGRDSTVINTGGEKVYTVEVERALLDHPQISDAIVVGLPHPRFGSTVVAVVEAPALSAEGVDVQEIQSFCGQHLADYKVPRQIFITDSLRRAANGKPDYDYVTNFAAEQLARG